MLYNHIKIFMWHLKEIVWADFSRHALLKAKICLVNLDSHKLIHSKRFVKNVYITSLKEIVGAVLLETHFCSHFWFILTYFRYSDFRQNLEILYIPLFGTVHEICYFYPYYFLRYKVMTIPPCSHTHTHAQFSKGKLLDSRDLKTHKSGDIMKVFDIEDFDWIYFFHFLTAFLYWK